MKASNILIAILVMFITASCKDDQMQRVMSVHDEVMPKMGSMAKLAGELSSKEDSTDLGLDFKRARRDLQDAREGMMDWMQSFGNRFDSDEILNGKELSEQKQLWLNEEEESIKVVRDKINSSIKNAEALLEKNKVAN